MKRVLVVDDEPSILRLMVKALGEEEDLEVVGAVNVAGVRAIAAGWAPDLMVVDLGLPNGSFADVAGIFPGVPALTISGRITDDQRVDLPKPFSMTTLIRRVEQLLGGPG